MCFCIFQDFVGKLLLAHVFLCVLRLTSSNDAVEATGNYLQTQSELQVPNTTVSGRHSRSPLDPVPIHTAKMKPDARSYALLRTSHDLEVSGSEARRTAKSPLVLRLLEEQEQTDVSVPMAFPPKPQLQPAMEEETVYYHQAPQDIAGGVQGYAEPQKDALTDKVVEVYDHRFMPPPTLIGVS
jgi:hypothetical protein